MDPTIATSIGQVGAVAALSFAAIGSALGTGAAATAAVGAWKKSYAKNEPALFQAFIYAGAPLSQTIYGMILMFAMDGKAKAGAPWPLLLGMGIVAGLAMGASSWMQGRAGAAACHAHTDTGQGLTNYLGALGIVETVAIFVMVFMLIILG
jgi:V/A-type H+/Na+-transporting ATPase subunit K